MDVYDTKLILAWHEVYKLFFIIITKFMWWLQVKGQG